jgi:hypothetical protein
MNKAISGALVIRIKSWEASLVLSRTVGNSSAL